MRGEHEDNRVFNAICEIGKKLLYLLLIALYEWVKVKMVDPELLIYILNVILAVLALFAFKWFREATARLRAAAELLHELAKALEDASLTTEELSKIVEKALKIVGG
jgi:nitrate reductase assembly molybdenum cofactor insertion protein NarJ